MHAMPSFDMPDTLDDYGIVGEYQLDYFVLEETGVAGQFIFELHDVELESVLRVKQDQSAHLPVFRLVHEYLGRHALRQDVLDLLDWHQRYQVDV